jgi:hypothetical protein
MRQLSALSLQLIFARLKEGKHKGNGEEASESRNKKSDS